MVKIKTKLSKFYKFLIQKLFKYLHGEIYSNLEPIQDKEIKIEKVRLKNEYKVYICSNSRLYTDTIHDTAIIKNNKIVNGPSFQYRSNKNADCGLNSVFSKGTPRFKKKIKGNVLSLLTGGGGNSNYWHWLFDVLPRLHIIEKLKIKVPIDYYLFPNLNKKFQYQTLDILKIPNEKRLSSIKLRHFEANQIIVTDHPYNILNNPLKDSLNIPDWIIDYLKKKFFNSINFDEKKNINFPNKIFINRKDGKSHRFIINENEVEELLLNKGFKSVKLSDYSFTEQIMLFKKASFVIGLHGAGFANTVFCDPGTKIIELKSVSAGDMFKNLCIKNNLSYKSICSENKKFNWNNQHGDIEIDTKLLKSLLNF